MNTLYTPSVQRALRRQLATRPKTDGRTNLAHRAHKGTSHSLLFFHSSILPCFLTVFSLLLLHSVSAVAHQEIRFVQEFGGKGEGQGKFAKTVFIAFDRQGGIYVTDTAHQRIQKLNSDGQFQFEIRGRMGRRPKTDGGTNPAQTARIASTSLGVTQNGENTNIERAFRLISPADIAVGTNSTIYVMDWCFIPREGTYENPQTLAGGKLCRIFDLVPCVLMFDEQGRFIARHPLHGNRETTPLQVAVPGLDADGNYALIIPPGDQKRSILLSVDGQSNIYVLDEGKIRKLNPNGQPVKTYSLAQPQAGQVIEAADMTVDREGNLYIVDKKAHRVLKYDAEGRFIQSFGEYGDKAGQFISPTLITLLDDGTLLVSDEAKYKKDTVSELPSRRYDPFQFGGFPHRIFRTRFRRVQRFTATGAYLEKILIRFDREDEARANHQLKAIDYSGNIYFINTETLRFSKFAPTGTLIRSAFQTEVKLRYTFDIEDIEIDNQDDLDADFFNKADFDERAIANIVDAKVTLAYDLNESFRFSISNTVTFFRLFYTDFYRARDFEDFRGIFNQDDESTQTFIDDRVQVALNLIRDHNPYRYREAGVFAYLNVIRNDFINDALHPRNFRYFDFTARISDWGGGIRYDLGTSVRLRFELAHFIGYNRYTYHDEVDILYATGRQDVDDTRAFLLIDGSF